MKFAITIVTPPGYIHSQAFSEVAESLHHGLLSLGHDSLLTTEGNLPGRQHIVLGSNLLPGFAMPLARDVILYNLEQVQLGSPWFKPPLLALFRQYRMWDYSERNALALRTLGVNVSRVVPIGYVPELTRIEAAPEQDIDVLFVGSMNPRRQAVVDQMGALGLRVGAAFGVYGKDRDALIARARLQLNVHHYDAKVLEMVRISYLLANRCAVLSEHSSNRAEDAALEEGVAFADYAGLAQRARDLIDAPQALEQLRQKGFEIMQARPTGDYLRVALAAA
ncbi:hypothetical protein BH11PSE7_BH11PSE7_11200 [soil metagenome]